MAPSCVSGLSTNYPLRPIITLLNSSLPVQPAMAILRLSALPKMGYLLRTIKPSITAKAAALFDAKVIETAIAKLRLPQNLSSGAHLQLTLPIRLGGFGLRSMFRSSYAAYWSGLAQAAPEVPGPSCPSDLEALRTLNRRGLIKRGPTST